MTGADDPLLRASVEEAVVRMFVATDERDWAALAALFADPFTLDMTSMVGGEPAVMTPTQVTEAWREGFRNLDAVHHQVGNFRTTVEGKHAKVLCYGVAWHYRKNIAAAQKTRTFVGTYEIHLVHRSDGWVITVLRFNLKFIDGNLELDKA
jgi:hypothetical protein